MNKKDLETIRDLSEKYDVPVSMHVAETEKEFDEFINKHGMTPVEYLDSIGLLNNRFIAACDLRHRKRYCLNEKKKYWRGPQYGCKYQISKRRFPCTIDA